MPFELACICTTLGLYRATSRSLSSRRCSYAEMFYLRLSWLRVAATQHRVHSTVRQSATCSQRHACNAMRTSISYSAEQASTVCHSLDSTCKAAMQRRQVCMQSKNHHKFALANTCQA